MTRWCPERKEKKEKKSTANLLGKKLAIWQYFNYFRVREQLHLAAIKSTKTCTLREKPRCWTAQCQKFLSLVLQCSRLILSSSSIHHESWWIIINMTIISPALQSDKGEGMRWAQVILCLKQLFSACSCAPCPPSLRPDLSAWVLSFLQLCFHKNSFIYMI